MRYLIFGAGAIGGGIGGLLSRAGRDVTLLARGAHLDALQADGLHLIDASGDHRLPVPAVGTVAEAEVGPGDVVVLTTKSQDTGDALAALVAGAHPDVVIVCAQNGVDNERQAARAFSRVYGLAVLMPATHLTPGEVSVDADGYPGVLDLGAYPAGTDEVAAAIAEDLRAAGFASLDHPAIMRRKYRKLLLNLSNVLDAAASGPEIHELHQAAMAEALEVFANAGIEVGSAEEDLERRQGMRVHRRLGQATGSSSAAGSSTWQSLVKGGRLESDYFNGEVVLAARLSGQSAPVNEVLWRLGHRVLRDGIAPRALDAASVAAEVAEAVALHGG